MKITTVRLTAIVRNGKALLLDRKGRKIAETSVKRLRGKPNPDAEWSVGAWPRRCADLAQLHNYHSRKPVDPWMRKCKSLERSWNQRHRGPKDGKGKGMPVGMKIIVARPTSAKTWKQAVTRMLSRHASRIARMVPDSRDSWKEWANNKASNNRKRFAQKWIES
jgi:hypothetical protein